MQGAIVALTTIAGMFGERYGDHRPAVLALHGWGRDHSDFAAALHDIPSIALDLPGFGASAAPESVMGTDGYARAVGAVLAEFSSPPVVIGHSFGGRVALNLAATRPVSGLVLVSVPLLRTAPVRRPSLGYRLRKSFRFLLGEDRLERARHRYGSPDYRAATGVMRDILVAAVNETYEDLLPKIECPTRLVWGREDREVPVHVAEAAAELIPDARLRVVPDVGHHPLIDAPEIVRAEILELL
ncbi:2-hydroxy-6-oxo-6-(2'-aminophenyl)hexa-2, 4-dienoic acid hydrolase [bacterium BMS3Abin02]|nr:2-hydroxy-6-oxo-6-(2'-aminophenyl)hexa-2, 4-dienoic acid hydrolase [bacterium BMS3Abin02]GBE20719.1 2-hydroxy-6-oxo-6-(2'-aminophenyl)hexa-2, 4-dienoic acid hydrolase [bacterium BMS3Bbin01]HDH27337.1 alpha/beta hydrolase [Actinomycetota bacterium]